MSVTYLDRPDGHKVAYSTIDGDGPGLIFLPGFRSDMNGTKALALAEACAAGGRQYTRLDYQGHGLSSGDFVDGTIGQWASDAIAVLDAIDGPQVLVGSSMGGWIMLLVALARPERIAALVGVAAAPDFTEDLMWARMPEDIRQIIMTEGRWDQPSEYDPEPTPITKKLIEEGRNQLVLTHPMPLTCPLRLIHGTADPDVPWELSMRLANHIASDDVTVTLIKDGDHRLSDDLNLQRIVNLALITASEVS